MNCKNCGFQLDGNDRFCKNCGAPVINEPVQTIEVLNNEQKNNLNNMGVNNETLSANINNLTDNDQNNSNLNPSSVFNNIDNRGNANLNNNMNTSFTNYNNLSTDNIPNYNYQSIPNNVNNYNNMQNNNKPKNNKTIIFIIIGVVVAIALFFGIKSINSIKDKLFSSDGGTSGTLTNNSNNNYKVTYKNFTFTIPGDYVYEVTGSGLLIGDQLDNWAMLLDLTSGSFTKIKSNKANLQSYFIQQGFSASVAKEATYGGVEYITLELSKSGESALIAYSKLNSMYSAGVIIYTGDNSFDYSLLTNLAPILSSATYSDSTSNIKSDVGYELFNDSLFEE